MNRRTLLSLSTLIAGVVLPWSVRAAAPEPIRIIVPFPAGGSVDYAARLIGQKVAEQTSRTVVVENRTGASGDIGAAAVARAAPDGNTLLFGAVSLVTNPLATRTPGFFPGQLVPVGVGIDSDLVTITRVDLGVKDVRDLLALAHSKPGRVAAASAGVATLSHLGIELLGATGRVSFNHIPYRGSVPAVTDMIAGQTDILIETVFTAAPYIKSGKVAPLAVHSAARNPLLPDVPTYAEQGFNRMDFAAWNVFLVPAGTSARVRQKLHDELARAISTREVTASLISRGLKPVVRAPHEYETFMRSEAEKWGKIIREANISI